MLCTTVSIVMVAVVLMLGFRLVLWAAPPLPVPKKQRKKRKVRQ